MSSQAKCFMWLSFLISTMIILSKPAFSSHIESLPGFSGPLPFKLETGYIGVGEHEVVQLFYYFVESEGNPTEDPLVLWMVGGPGCSGLCGLWFEIGPLKFNMVRYNGSLPAFSLNPHSWTKWLASHPKFIANPVYIAGDSYSGKPVPIVATYISFGNEAGEKPEINIKGYVLGNPATDPKFDWNSRIPFAHRTALISDDSTRGEYVRAKKDNLPCQKDLQAISERTNNTNFEHILEPKCPYEDTISDYRKDDRRILQEKYRELLLSSLQNLRFGCRNYENLLLHVWANDVDVQKALHVRMGTVNAWIRCNRSIIYTNDVQSSIAYHRYLRTKYFRALIYSGDHDMFMPYLGTLWWLNSLNSTIADDWRPWIVGDQVAGYTREYSNNINFSTVKGAGHTAPEYKPKECFEMFKRWISHEPL